MHYRSLLASWLVLALPACTSDAGEDTDTDAGTQTGSTSGSTSVDGPTSSSTSSSSSAVTGSESSSDTSGPAESSSSGGADESSSGGVVDNICYGYTLLGFLDQVFTDGTATGDPVCTTDPAGCGGDVEGVWTAEAACGYEVLPNFFEEICAGSTQQITGSSINGTRTFNEDGTFDFDQTTQLQADLQVDSIDCAGIECGEFATGLSEEPGLEMTCADAKGGGCDCTYTLDLVEAQTGTWNLFGGDLLLTSDDDEVLGVFEYCVDAGRFSMWTPLFDGTPFPDTSCTENDECEAQVDGDFDVVGCDAPEDAER